MNTKVLMLLALPLLVSGRPTHCERENGDAEFRCAKDNYRADRVLVRNISGRNVAFKVGKWFSKCGRPGVNYADQRYSLAPGGTLELPFEEAKEGACNELYVYDCKRDNDSVDCLNVVSVYPVD